GRLCMWSAVFGNENLEVRSFEHAKRAITADFATTVGVDAKAVPIATGHENPQLSAEAQEFLRLINRHLPRYLKRKKNPDRGGIGDALSRGFAGQSKKPSADEAREFYKAFAPSNQLLLRELVPSNR